MINRKYPSALAAVLAASALMVASHGAMAAVICNAGTVPFTIPVNIDGIYINFITGTTGTSGGAVPGYDFDPYSGSSGLNFYFGGGADVNNGAVFNGTTYPVLANGTMIGAASTFSGTTADASMTAWRAGGTGFLGVRFTNENTGVANFGWVNITTTAGTGFPATVNSYCYDNTGGNIMAGTTPVSLQSFSVD